jgi:hypothetical protein
LRCFHLQALFLHKELFNLVQDLVAHLARLRYPARSTKRAVTANGTIGNAIITHVNMFVNDGGFQAHLSALKTKQLSQRTLYSPVTAIERVSANQ